MTINDTLAHIFKEAYVGSLCLRELQGKGVVVEGLEQQLTLLCDRALAAFFWEDAAELRDVTWEGNCLMHTLLQFVYGIGTVTVLL